MPGKKNRDKISPRRERQKPRVETPPPLVHYSVELASLLAPQTKLLF